MKYLLHGDDTTSSRKFLSELTSGFNQTVLDGKNVTVLALEEAVVSTSLFEEKKAVIVENLFLKNKNKKNIVKWLNGQNSLVSIIFWEDGKVPKTLFSTLKEFEVREFSLPQNYFLFLDSFTPKNTKKVYSLFEELVSQKGAELVFYSILKRIRLLLMLESGAKGVLEIEKLAPWQISRLQNQLKLWPSEKLFKFYSLLQDTEIKLKSGGLPVSLAKHLDILILSELSAKA